MATNPDELHEGMGEEPTGRTRRFLRIFLMVAGGLAAPCLALAAFFLTSNGDDTPAAKSSIQGGRVTTATTARARPAAPVTTTTTTTPAPPSGPPARDPFQPLVSQSPTGGTPRT